jgi:hypothetical protein
MAYFINKGKLMTKARKVIVLITPILLILAYLFEPVQDIKMNEQGNYVRTLKWEINQYFLDQFRSNDLNWDYIYEEDVQILEIFGIIIFAVAAFWIDRKKRHIGILGITKVQGIIILAASILIVFSILTSFYAISSPPVGPDMRVDNVWRIDFGRAGIAIATIIIMTGAALSFAKKKGSGEK